jgi:hypothetical protein
MEGINCMVRLLKISASKAAGSSEAGWSQGGHASSVHQEIREDSSERTEDRAESNERGEICETL